MENNGKTILTPGASVCNDTVNDSAEQGYLHHDNFLSEFKDERERQLARTNLEVLSSSETMRRVEIENAISENVSNAISDHKGETDPHNIIPAVDRRLEGYVKRDGLKGFTGPVSGKNPVSSSDLTTKEYVDDTFYEHVSDRNDPHNTMNLVNETLQSYAMKCDVYPRTKTYSRVEVDTLIKDMVKNDGTTPFKAPQQGVYPKSSADLTTKAYVDDVIKKHVLDEDPHGLMTYLSGKFDKYYTKDEVYTKEETYSRPQLESKIESLMDPVVERAIRRHLQEDDPHGTMESVRAMNYVKADGTVPFEEPVSGVPGVKPEHLATIGDIDFRVAKIREEFNEDIESIVWKTSGPVQSTVGHVEDNTELPSIVTFQQIMDKIFYGDGVTLDVPEYAQYGQRVDVTMGIRPTMLIDVVKLYQNGKLIGVFSRDDFEPSGQYTTKSEPITINPTEFKMEVSYTNGNIKSVTASIGIAYGVYVGIMPKWMHGSQMTIDYMESMVVADPTNNKKSFLGDNTLEYTIHYSFDTPEELKSIYIALPVDYPNLAAVDTVAQQFPANQFDKISNIPLTLDDGQIVMYKIYIFPAGIVELDMDVTYKLQK